MRKSVQIIVERILDNISNGVQNADCKVNSKHIYDCKELIMIDVNRLYFNEKHIVSVELLIVNMMPHNA